MQNCLHLDQEIEILNGPISGRIGKLLRLQSGNRETVLLNVLGQNVQS